MTIPESQLQVWANQGAENTAKATADSIKNALQSFKSWPSHLSFSKDCELYLQGSYKNSTNIRGDSDVDVVVQLNSPFMSNLSEDERAALGFIASTYRWSNFKMDVLTALNAYYGHAQVAEGKKSLKVRAGNGRLAADVVVCLEYRKYNHDSIWVSPVSGITFWAPSEQRWIINYPKLHYERGVSKNQITNEWYKPAVRIFKNMRNYMEQKGIISAQLAPSYFLECLLYNIPNSKFGTSYQQTVYDIMDWLGTADLETFFCQNGQTKLFGSTPEQWSPAQAREFISSAITFWNHWSNASLFNQYR